MKRKIAEYLSHYRRFADVTVILYGAKDRQTADTDIYKISSSSYQVCYSLN